MAKFERDEFEKDDIIEITEDLARNMGDAYDQMPKGSLGIIIRVNHGNCLVRFHPAVGCISNHDIGFHYLKRTGEKFDKGNMKMYYVWYPVKTIWDQIMKRIDGMLWMRSGYPGVKEREFKPLSCESMAIRDAIGDFAVKPMREIEEIRKVLVDGKSVKAYEMLGEMLEKLHRLDYLTDKIETLYPTVLTELRTGLSRKVMVENVGKFCEENGYEYKIKEGDNGVTTMVVDAADLEVHIGEKGIGIESIDKDKEGKGTIE